MDNYRRRYDVTPAVSSSGGVNKSGHVTPLGKEELQLLSFIPNVFGERRGAARLGAVHGSRDGDLAWLFQEGACSVEGSACASKGLAEQQLRWVQARLFPIWADATRREAWVRALNLELSRVLGHHRLRKADFGF